jgi:hypothetical protein
MIIRLPINDTELAHVGGLIRPTMCGGTDHVYHRCVERNNAGMAANDHSHQRGDGIRPGIEAAQAQSDQGLPDARGDAGRKEPVAQCDAALDYDWPALSYRPTLPDAPDTDWPAGDYCAPVIAKEPVVLFAVGSRVRVLGVGYGTVARHWEGWIVVKCDLLGMVVGKKEHQLLSA